MFARWDVSHRCPVSNEYDVPLWPNFPPKEQLLGSLASVPQVECYSKAVRFPVSQRERRWNRAGCLLSFVTVFRTLYASTPNPRLHLPLSHSVNRYCSCIVLEAELTLEDELGRVWPDFRRDHVLMCFRHRRVVLLTRSSQMWIKMNDYYNTFCVACWMNLHVNCRPI